MTPRTAALLLLAALLVQCAEGGLGRPRAQDARATPTANAATLRLGAWNLEHFGARDKFRDRPDSPPNRTAAELKKVADFIAAMRVDVLALEEIDGPEVMRTLCRDLGGDWAFTLGTSGGFRGTWIRVGFLWNRARVQLLQCEEMNDFPSKHEGLAVFHRKPVNAVFRTVGGGLDFRAIVVHLKASRGRTNEQKRTAEVTILREYLKQLQARAGEDQDIVVLGDFNHTYDAPAFQAFTAGGLVQYARTAPTPTIVWFPEPIDQIALTAGIREEVVEGSFRVHNQQVDFGAADAAQVEAGKKAWRQAYSDHFPVTIDLRAARDGDPDATFAPPVHQLQAQGAR